MPDKLFSICIKYREMLSYLFFGVLTTIVNYVTYLAWMAAFTGKYANVTGTCVSWFMSVLFAYFTNRKWVFQSAVSGLVPQLKECAAFFVSRLFSGLIDLGVMFVFVDVWGYNGKIVKLLSNVFVVILNYILSRFMIFKRR